MNKFLLILLLFLVTCALAINPQGPFADVELVSGTKQRAQFLGIQNDTVQLGGYINNKFTIVRIAKNRFKSIVDTTGRNLLETKTDTVSVIDTTKTIDSVLVEKSTPDTTTSLKLKSNTVFLGYETQFLDNSLFVLQIQSFSIGFLIENGIEMQIVSKKEFPQCSDNICIQKELAKLGAKTIYRGNIFASAKNDSFTVELSRIEYEENLPAIYKSTLRVPAMQAFSNSISNNNLKIFLMEAIGQDVSFLKNQKSYVHIETDPEGATISLAEKDAICKSPCTFSILDTTSVTINAFWSVENHLWGNQTTIKPIPGDTIKRSLKLKRVNPELRIITNPSDVEIFSSKEEITKSSKAFGKTPDRFFISEPGLMSFRLRKIGFKDSLIWAYVPPVGETTLNIEMQPITDFNEIQIQQKWAHDRYVMRIGRTLMGSSIAPLVVGTLFTILGQFDYDEAKDIKDEMSIPTANGDYYQKQIKKNKDLVNAGDTKTIIGGSLIGLGVLIFGIGFAIAF